MKKWINPLERTIQRKQEHQQRNRGNSMVGNNSEPPGPVVWHFSRVQEEYSLFTVCRDIVSQLGHCVSYKHDFRLSGISHSSTSIDLEAMTGMDFK